MRIQKAEISSSEIRVILDNGVIVNLSFNNRSYIHLSFSGIDYDEPIRASIMAHSDDVPTVQGANYMDISYTPKKRD